MNKSIQIKLKGGGTFTLTSAGLAKLHAAGRTLAAFGANEIDKDLPIREGLIDDETFGIKWAEVTMGQALKEANKFRDYFTKVESLRELSKYVHVGAIAPHEDIADAMVDKVEALVVNAVAFDKHKDGLRLFVENVESILLPGSVHGSIKNDADGLPFGNMIDLLKQVDANVKQRLIDKDRVSKELSDERNMLTEFLLTTMNISKDITDHSTTHGAAMNLMLDQRRKIANLDEKLTEVATHRDKLEQRLTDITKEHTALSNTLQSFDKLLELTLAHVLSNRANFTDSQKKTLLAIAVFND